jgi:hypothetical protein
MTWATGITSFAFSSFSKGLWQLKPTFWAPEPKDLQALSNCLHRLHFLTKREWYYLSGPSPFGSLYLAKPPNWYTMVGAFSPILLLRFEIKHAELEWSRNIFQLFDFF